MSKLPLIVCIIFKKNNNNNIINTKQTFTQIIHAEFIHSLVLISRLLPYMVICKPVYDSGFIEDRATKFACSTGFSAVADRVVWPPSLSRDQKWPHLTEYTHSQVVCYRFEGSLVIIIITIIFIIIIVVIIV